MGQGIVLLGAPRNEVRKVENQGLARATQPTHRPVNLQAGQAKLFVGAYKFW